LEAIQSIQRGKGAQITTDFPSTIEDHFKKATEIWIIGVNANAALKYSFRNVIESKLKRGEGSIKILLVNPGSPACEMAAARVPGRLSVEREKANILANLSDLYDLKKLSPKRLEVRVIDDPLMYGCYMLNLEKISGAIYYRRYSYQMGEKLIYYLITNGSTLSRQK
jgi:hypothetical protein